VPTVEEVTLALDLKVAELETAESQAQEQLQAAHGERSYDLLQSRVQYYQARRALAQPRATCLSTQAPRAAARSTARGYAGG